MPKKILSIGIIFLIGSIVTVGIAGIWFWQQLQPVSSQDTSLQAFSVPKGQAISVIANRLAEEGYIKHPLAFRFVVWREGLEQDIQAGSFDIGKSMTVEEIALTLTKGTEDLWVTIPEGKRVEEISMLFSELSEFDAQEFITLAKPDEGFLFPDTYLFPRLATSRSVHSLLRTTFDEKFSTEVLPTINPTEAEVRRIVTLASLVERESRHPEDMKMVAGILQNRLDLGMPLQVDATLQYIKAKGGENWWPTPLAVDKELESPYNTYKYPGLPPGPIANPGLNALRAAAQPTQSEYLYYISDRQGNMHYAVTYDEHLANVNKYLR